jgi:alpha-glucosidase
MTVTRAPGHARASALSEPHHDGSELYVLQRPEEIGGNAVLRVRTPSGAADSVLLRYTLDGEPRTVKAVVDEEAGGETWWRAELPVSSPSVRYRWLLAGGDTGYGWLNGRGVSPHEVPGSDDFALVVASPAPSWHGSSVVYEVYPDRFAASGARYEAPDWAVAREWDALPEGRGPNTSHEWFGGDLPGVEQRLDHVDALGANVLYFTPFFPAGSTHRYDAASFDRVDPLLGGDEALASLLRAAQARGMRVVGDLTMNHTGNLHDWFVRASEDTTSAERALYTFDPSEKHGYASWLDVKSLPTLDWQSAELRTRMEGVLRRWIDAGLDGWRIDVANMVGRRRDVDVNHEVARWTRDVVADSLLIAEHGHDFRPDLDGRGWQGVMNYAGFLKPAWWWLRSDAHAEDVFSSAPAPLYRGAEAVAVMRAWRAGVPWEGTINSWNLLDSHDTARFRTVTGSYERHVVGIGLQMTTPGVPMVFAGDEVGLEGEWGEDARRTIPWDRPDAWDTRLLREYRTLIALRRSNDALARGGIRYVHVSDDAIAYVRETRNERLLCLAARASHDPIAVSFAQLETLYGGDAHDGVLPADGPAFHVWRITNG